jgi:hypothetical protein
VINSFTHGIRKRCDTSAATRHSYSGFDFVPR